ncbi:TetR/AcrR family transcriptional regulator [Paenibacillus luteus]|uniref:TetR/AcrR family transcriptional regulator n=1 Tax=Paenibacillus luteus TaxID=2545753 RepID=UPI00114400FA|nr:TetR/AcrR family transcriptional regulator [Paenibacillus luteus]
MESKVDRRKIRTKNLLRRALIELIEENGVEAITVSDITKKADINRGTFYLHYRDVSDLLEQNKHEILEGLKDIIVNLNLPDLLVYASKDEPYPTIIKVFEYFTVHTEFFKVILGPKGDPSYSDQIKTFMKNQLMNKIPEWQPEESKIIVPPGYLIAFITSANLGILQHWFETGLKESPEELALIITRMISKGVLNTTGLL